ncbi:MAG TPA: peptidoglycan bridge formation glycyltransferase FemA/FemB family protein, partial [Candidatus Limnocylindrales bacterium]
MVVPAVREATLAELEDWDRWTVDRPGGNVLQSLAWGQYQLTRGLRPRFLIDAAGGRTLALERPWAIAHGGTAYLPRGPVTDPGSDLAAAADRLRAVSDWLAERGADAVTSDAEIPADSGYGLLLRQRGFRPAEEEQPSRHRLSLPLGPGASEAGCLANMSMSTRQRVRGAQRHGLEVLRYEASPRALDEPGLTTLDVAELPVERLAAVLEGFYPIVLGTALRRHFRMAPLARFVDWSTRALVARLALLLEVRAADGELLGGALLYRHGRRLTYATAADRAEARRSNPGAIHLLLWRAIQIALAEGLDELDLAGVDVAGARHRPAEGDPMYGLLAFKESFGGQWIELVGNQQRMVRPMHYAVGRTGNRLANV